MIVEDELIVALEIQDRLVRAGHLVVGTVTSGEEAIEHAARLQPDLILIDIKLRGVLDGIDAAVAIRKQSGAALVFLTAFTDPATLKRAEGTEPHGYILKPFNERDLLAVVAIAIDCAQAQRIKLRDHPEAQ